MAAAETQTSFFPYYEFTMNIVNDTATVLQFLLIGQGPHDWEPTIYQALTLTNADVIVYNGLGVDELVGSGDFDHTSVIKAAVGLTLITTNVPDVIGSVLEECEHGHYDVDISEIHNVIDNHDVYNISLDYHTGGR